MAQRMGRPPRLSSRTQAPGSLRDTSTDHVGLGLTVAALVAMAGATLLPLWLPLVLAAWFAHLARPLSQTLARRLRGKQRAASVVVVLLVVLGLAPLVLIVLSLTEDATVLAQRLLASTNVSAAFEALMAGKNGTLNLRSMLDSDPGRLFSLLRNTGTSAVDFASTVAGATIAVAIGAVVFVTGFYVFLVTGQPLATWLERNVPLTRRQYRGFVSAFYETGRGLIFGVGLTAFAQGAIAGVGYVIVGVSHALALALLTAFAALVPSVGTALVWGPMAAAFALTGNVTEAVIVLVVGGIAGAADNFIRPALSRFGRLRVPMFVLFCSMLGGLVAFGAPGLIVGPLFVRMSMEGLRQWRQRHAPVLVPSAAATRTGVNGELVVTGADSETGTGSKVAGIE